MKRSILAVAAASAALSLAACGADDATAPSAATVKASVEQAGHVKLVSAPIPEDAAKQGLTASFSNGPDVARDGQVVFLFMVKDADIAGDVAKGVRGMIPGGSKLIVDDNVIVLYASSGKDRGADIERAVKAL